MSRPQIPGHDEAWPSIEPLWSVWRWLPGLAPVIIPAEARQRMGLKVGVVEKREMTRILRLPARIVADETRQSRVTTKIEGFVEVLNVSATGQVVKKGDPLLTIYSPALVAAQEEYHIALQSGMPIICCGASENKPSLYY